MNAPSKQWSNRVGDIRSFLAMDVMEKGMAMAAAGEDIVQLGVGEPAFEPPKEVIAATQAALANGKTHYTDSRGLVQLREAIAADCNARRGSQVSADQVFVTGGTSPAMLAVFQMLLNPGDEVITPSPYYACYPNFIRLAGGVPVLVPTRPEDAFRLDVEAVRAKITPKTKGILLASPANPTGAVQPPEVIEALCGLGVPILSDEIYAGLVYDAAQVVSPLKFRPDTFVFDGFSKRYAMTGFRLGYVIAPPDAKRPLKGLLQNLFISTNEFVQYAGLAALADGAPHVEMMRAAYAERRDRLVDGLNRLGLKVARAPQGAFYAFADARHLGEDSLALAYRILSTAKVACGPGRDFGPDGEGFLRFSFSVSLDAIDEGLRRLENALPELAKD